MLLPASKGKAAGGDGPPYGETLSDGHALDGPRRSVLDALVVDARTFTDAEVARLAGVGVRDARTQRETLARLADLPTVPAHRRYTGVVHGNAGLADVAPRRARVDVRIVSALLGLVALHEPVPDYRVELAATLPTLGGLATFWRRELAGHLQAVARGRVVWDLLPGEHRRAITPDALAGAEVRAVAFVRPDGRAANAARTKVAKGRFAAALLADPTIGPQQIRGIDLGEGWRCRVDGDGVVAVSHH